MTTNVSLLPTKTFQIKTDIEGITPSHEKEKSSLQLYHSYLTGVRADLFKALVQAKIIGSDGILTEETKATLIPFSLEEITLIRDHLNQSIEFEGETFTILDMLKKLRSPPGSSLVFKDYYLCGSDVLFIIFHLCPKYIERFFAQLNISHLFPLVKNVLENHPFIASDGDIRVIIKRADQAPLNHKEFSKLASSMLDVVSKKKKSFFRKTGFESFKPLNKGYVSFFLVHPKNSFFELILLNNWVRNHLFSQDALGIPLLPILISGKEAQVTPTNHEDNGAQPLFDALLGMIRSHSLEEIDTTGYFRFLREMTRGKSSCTKDQKNFFIQKNNRYILEKENGITRFITQLRKRIKNSYLSSEEGDYFFFYLINALIHFQGKVSEKTIQALVEQGNCLKELTSSHPLILTIATLLFEHKVHFKEMIAVLSLIFLLDYTKNLNQFKIEIGNHEGDSPTLQVAFKYDKELLYLQLPCAFDEAIETLSNLEDVNKELFKLFVSLFPINTLGPLSKQLPILPITYANFLKSPSPFLRIFGFHLFITLSKEKKFHKQILFGCIKDLWDLYSNSREHLLKHAERALGRKQGELDELLKKSNFLVHWIITLLKYHKTEAAYIQLKKIICTQEKQIFVDLLKHFDWNSLTEKNGHKISWLILKWIEEDAIEINEPILMKIIALCGRRQKARQLLIDYEKKGVISTSSHEYTKLWIDILKNEFINNEISLEELLWQSQEKFEHIPTYLCYEIQDFLSPYLHQLDRESPHLFRAYIQSNFLKKEQKQALRKQLIHRLIQEKKLQQAEQSYLEYRRFFSTEDLSPIFKKLFRAMIAEKNWSQSRKLLLDGICPTPILTIRLSLDFLEQIEQKIDEDVLVLLLKQIQNLDQDHIIHIERILTILTFLDYSPSLSKEVETNIRASLLPIVTKLTDQPSTPLTRSFINWLYFNDFYLENVIFQSFWLKETMACISINYRTAKIYLDFARAKKMYQLNQQLCDDFIFISLSLMEIFLNKQERSIFLTLNMTLLLKLEIPSHYHHKVAELFTRSLAHLFKEGEYRLIFQVIDLIMKCNPTIDSKQIGKILTQAVEQLIDLEKFEKLIKLICDSDYLFHNIKTLPALSNHLKSVNHYFLYVGFQQLYMIKKSFKTTSLAYQLMTRFPSIFVLKDWERLVRLLTTYNPTKIPLLWKDFLKWGLFSVDNTKSIELCFYCIENFGKTSEKILPPLLKSATFLALMEGKEEEHINLEIAFLSQLLEVDHTSSSKEKEIFLTQIHGRFIQLCHKAKTTIDSLDFLELQLIKALLKSKSSSLNKKGEDMIKLFVTKTHIPEVLSQYGALINVLVLKKKPISTLQEMIDVIEITPFPDLQLDLVIPYLLSDKTGVLLACQLMSHSLKNLNMYFSKNLPKHIVHTYLSLLDSEISTQSKINEFCLDIIHYQSLSHEQSLSKSDFNLILFLQKSRTLDFKQFSIASRDIHQAVETLATTSDNSPLVRRAIKEIAYLFVKLSELEPGVGASFLEATWKFWVEFPSTDNHFIEKKMLLIRNLLMQNFTNHTDVEFVIDQCIILCYYLCIVIPRYRKKLNDLLPVFRKTITQFGSIKNKNNFKYFEEKVTRNKNTKTLLSEAVELSRDIFLLPHQLTQQSLDTAIKNIGIAETHFEAFSYAHITYLYLYIIRILRKNTVYVSPNHFINLGKQMGKNLKNPPKTLMPYLFSCLHNAAFAQYRHYTIEENTKNTKSLLFLRSQIFILQENIKNNFYKDFPRIYFYHIWIIFGFLAKSVEIGEINAESSGVPYLLSLLDPILNSYDTTIKKELEDYRTSLQFLWETKLNLKSTVSIVRSRLQEIVEEFKKSYVINRYLFTAS